jgi:hypothetical protein
MPTEKNNLVPLYFPSSLPFIQLLGKQTASATGFNIFLALYISELQYNIKEDRHSFISKFLGN